MAATASWLLSGADSARGSARSVRPVVENGQPIVFEWTGSGAASTLGITWSGSGTSRADTSRADTLRFDGAGRASVRLPPGEYRYRLAGGGGGTVAVEQYSDELLPHPVTLTAHEGRSPVTGGRRGARDRVWLFGLCVLGLVGEWIARRRLGLR